MKHTCSHVTLCGVHDGEVGPGEVVEVVPARLTLGVQLPPHEHGAESTEGSAHGVIETSIGRIRNLRKKIFIANDEL